MAFTVTGEGGGAWQLTHRSGRCHLEPGSPPDPTASISTTIDGAWRLFTQHPHTPLPTLAGGGRFALLVNEVVRPQRPMVQPGWPTSGPW